MMNPSTLSHSMEPLPEDLTMPSRVMILQDMASFQQEPLKEDAGKVSSGKGKEAGKEEDQDPLVPPRVEGTLVEDTTPSLPGEEDATELDNRTTSSVTVETATTAADTAVASESSGPLIVKDDLGFSCELGYNMDTNTNMDMHLGAPMPPRCGDSDDDGVMTNTNCVISRADNTPLLPRKERRVHFSFVEVREYCITIGDNPYCSRGAPITLDWEYSIGHAVPIELYESANKRQRRRRNARRMFLLDPIQRRNLLWRCGHDLEEIETAAKKNEKENLRQSFNLYLLPWFVLQEFLESQTDKVCCKRHFKNRESEQTYTEAQVRKLHQMQLASVDSETGGLAPWRQEAVRHRPVRRISFRGNNNNNSTGDGQSICSHVETHSFQSEGEWSSALSDDRSSAYPGSDSGHNHHEVDAKYSTYKIRTDPRQHDKATEIILCSIQRPHMRGFHASWFGFFIGFVMWFAITPLLGEVKETLNLTTEEIWTSSLCGTAVTVLARILGGPLCDVFGARRCMAAIVVVSAIPCGLTGLAQNAASLSAIRAFVGIAGSAFVPCQYWTSRMFAREVAGTANALVAGWGNLGGGITQLLMGSALFPLFKLIFQNYDNADELAWRTVFVVPALVAFMAAYVYIFHCDDSPKGDFAELVRQQQIEIVSPFWSLGMAIQNRNVLLLLVQYACCFGVEITMTNATALYMKEEFGQDTASAAAIASVFGIMNLFARGLGGYGSDYCDAKYGTKGRVYWQFFTLFMEGAGIVLFAYAETLVGAVFSLIYLSLWVQCAEGSTYGIVPYVNRRFTGAVVGWIGGGGTMGGVVFSIFFREFSYKKAFVLMGLAASGSAFLSIFMNMKSLAAIYQEKSRAEHIKNNNNFVFHDDAPIHEDGKSQ